ncbi:MAG: nicotinate (nicotinamide) nucleotide adenylyltransferase [Arcobacter sp.]|nr:nicotinate (nicotinamide) nucleotide adenylyltransferase [Arcobacter sp.]
MVVAVFGGSFDPPHIGHEKIVDLSLIELPIDKIFVVPTFLNPFKDTFHLIPEKRFELLATLFRDNPKVEICDFEILQNKKTATFETISFLKNNHTIERIYLIIGADNLKNIHLWYNFLELRELVQFVVVTRNAILLENDYIKPTYLELDIDASSTGLRENMNFDLIPENLKEKVKEIWKQE